MGESLYSGIFYAVILSKICRSEKYYANKASNELTLDEVINPDYSAGLRKYLVEIKKYHRINFGFRIEGAGINGRGAGNFPKI